MKIFLLFTLFFIFSCAKTTDELIESAKREAKFHLSSKSCSKARSALQDVGTQSKDPVWIGLMSSTYACDAGYSELDTLFNSGDISKLDATKLLTSLTTFSSSNETEADSDAYNNLKTAINLILNSDGLAQPTAAGKIAKFGQDPGTDLNMQALYMILVMTGKFFAYYGNTNAVGAKGAGTLGNSCIYSYSATDAAEYIAAVYGGKTCSSTGGGEGSDDLEAPATAAEIKTKMCEGIIWFNNLLNILSGITLSGSDSLGDLGNVEAAITALLDTAEAAETSAGGVFNDEVVSQDSVSTLRDITGQDECEAIDIAKIEKFYTIVFEGMLE